MAVGDSFERPLLRSRLYWKVVASYVAVLAVTTLIAGWSVRTQLAQRLQKDLQGVLIMNCQILTPFAAEVLQRDRAEEVLAELERLRVETGLRITLIRPDGSVLVDSHEDARRMDGHANRPEILEAQGGALGIERRVSHTLGYEMLYVARRVMDGERPLGYVRVALPVRQIDRQLGAAGRSVLLGTGAGFLVALALGLWLAGRLARPISQMTHTASELARGRYESRVRFQRRDELGQLGAALNQLGAENTRRLATLSEEDAQLRAMLASMIEGVVAVDENDEIAFINQAARELLDIGPRPIEGHTLWRLAPIRELEELLERARESGRRELLELDLFRGGRERVFQAHVSPFRGGGKAGFVLVLHDITEVRRLERVRRDFVANVSHELKTPLTSIQGFVETLLAGALQDQENNVRFLQRIDANVRRLTNLVSDLLSLARIESGQLAVQAEPVDWRQVLDGVLHLRESALSAKGLELVLEGRERALEVLGDREAMTQVLDNLIDNAIQYTPAPGKITVRLARRGGLGMVEVEDTGIGVPAADLNRIFERFYRVDKARSSAAGGTGLGLSIVKNLALRMHGEVEVDSAEGRGSTFRVLLPLA